MQGQSALPTFYYAIFAYYEPLLCIVGFLGAISDPKATHDQQASWPLDSPPPGPLPRATLVTMLQLAHVCALLGVINIFVLRAVRKHLSGQPALEEKIVRALLTPLVFGDVMHLYFTLWGLGDEKWVFSRYTPMLWTTIILGISLLVPRVAWHLGIGRYVHKRDSRLLHKE
ncbi:hypothetical protein HWV62_27733 [Athelia sp. TMB]|nr:hypothetical protein HWV62_27733 [Athelia sp. TMB]